jgi:8-oxo-dGTP pyrophosphatase MutT (NUDIX family)
MTNLLFNYLEQIYNTDLIEKKVNVSGGIIFKEQRGEKPALLLIQRAKDDHWPNFFEFPRGKCDNGPNEGLIACLKREVKEESGLDIIPLKFIDKFSYTADEGKRLSTQHNYLCKMKDPEQKVKLSKEHQGYQWITTPGEAELTVLPEMKRSIMKAFELIDPDTQLVNYPKNNFTPDQTIEEINMNLQEKIQYSENLVDQYIDESILGKVVAKTARAANKAVYKYNQGVFRAAAKTKGVTGRIKHGTDSLKNLKKTGKLLPSYKKTQAAKAAKDKKAWKIWKMASADYNSNKLGKF